MNLLDTILIAFALTTPVFSMALVANVQRCLSLFEKSRLSFLFTIFPVIAVWLGYWIGVLITYFMKLQTDWVFVVIALIISIRMISRALKSSHEDRTYKYGEFRVIFALSIALASPALLIGIGIPFVEMALYPFMISMAASGALMSVVGLIVGKKTGKYDFGNKILFFGGVLFVGVVLKHALVMFGLI